MKPTLPEGRCAINAPDVVTEDFDGQVVVLNLANGHYYSLDGIGGRIWSLILEGQALGAIAASIGAKRPDLLDEARDFIQQLHGLELIRQDETAAPSPDAIAEIWSGDAPRLIVYDDLAELIYADPIHDVDEQVGWPAPRPTE